MPAVATADEESNNTLDDGSVSLAVLLRMQHQRRIWLGDQPAVQVSDRPSVALLCAAPCGCAGSCSPSARPLTPDVQLVPACAPHPLAWADWPTSAKSSGQSATT